MYFICSVLKVCVWNFYSFHFVKLLLLLFCAPATIATAVPFFRRKCDRLFLHFSTGKNGFAFFVSSFHLVRWIEYKMCASTWMHYVYPLKISSWISIGSEPAELGRVIVLPFICQSTKKKRALHVSESFDIPPIGVWHLVCLQFVSNCVFALRKK